MMGQRSGSTSVSTETTHTQIRMWAIMSILSGVLLILLSVLLRPDPKIAETSGYWMNLLSSLLEVFGTAFLVVGVMNILIEAKDWREYFASRLQEIVINQSYIDSLEGAKLRSMQLSIAKSLYKTSALDGEECFYNYLQTKLEKFVPEPFREDVICDIHYEPVSEGLWRVRDKLSYICRRGGTQIQSHIRWQPSEGEFQSVRFLKIEVRPPFFVQGGEESCETLYEKSGGDLTSEAMSGASVDLAKFVHVDRLKVLITAEYDVDVERFQTWTMAHPTRNFSINIRYPESCILQAEPMVLDLALLDVDKEDKGFARIKYDSWMLPTSGLVWRVAKQTNAPVIECQQVQAAAA